MIVAMATVWMIGLVAGTTLAFSREAHALGWVGVVAILFFVALLIKLIEDPRTVKEPERGASPVEWALLLVLVAIVALVALQLARPDTVPISNEPVIEEVDSDNLLGVFSFPEGPYVEVWCLDNMRTSFAYNDDNQLVSMAVDSRLGCS